MKVAKKYDVDPIRNLILGHLEADWPQNVDDWIDFQIQMSKAIEQHLNNPPSYKYAGRYIDERFPEAGSALRFALDNNCTSLLSAVSMVLVTASPKANWNDIKRSKHDMQYEPFASKRTINFPCIRWHLLDPNDQFCLDQGRRALFKILDTMGNLEVPVIYGQQTCRQCSINLLAWRRRVMGGLNPKDRQNPDPIYILKQLLDSGRPDAVCGPCWDRAEKAVKAMRQTIWDDLPSMFGWQARVSN